MEILETFTGFVEDIREGIAYVILKTPDGEELEGTIKEEELQKHGIRNHRRFIVKTFKENGTVGLILESIPDIVVTEEMMQKIDEELRELLGDPPYNY